MKTYEIKDIESKYPLYYKTCVHLQKSLFYKNVFDEHEIIPVKYEIAERICSDAFTMCNSNWEEYVKKLKNLLEVDIEFLKLQASLEKNGK
jgi:hypothetical protein